MRRLLSGPLPLSVAPGDTILLVQVEDCVLRKKDGAQGRVPVSTLSMYGFRLTAFTCDAQ